MMDTSGRNNQRRPGDEEGILQARHIHSQVSNLIRHETRHFLFVAAIVALLWVNEGHETPKHRLSRLSVDFTIRHIAANR
jgi:hypothetical protein